MKLEITLERPQKKELVHLVFIWAFSKRYLNQPSINTGQRLKKAVNQLKTSRNSFGGKLDNI